MLSQPYTDYIPDQHTNEGLFTYTVILENESNGWEYFVCEAEDGEHAEEQAVDAEPEAVILWVNRGLNFSQENVYDVTIEAVVRKTYRVNAREEYEAEEIAHNIFSVLEDGTPENYEQNTIGVKFIDFDAGDT